MTTPLPNLLAILDPTHPHPALPSRLSGRILIQEATSTSFDANGVPTNGDLVIPNSSTRYFGNALGGRGVLGTEAALAVALNFNQLTYLNGHLPSSFMLTRALTGAVVPKAAVAAAPGAVTGPVEGYFQFDQPDVTHGFLIDQAHSPVSIQLAQLQMIYYLLHGIVIDPTAAPLAPAKATISSALGITWGVAAPPVMQIFGNPSTGLR